MATLRRPWLLLAALAAFCFAAGVVAGSLAPFVPLLIRDLRMTPVTAGIALGAWQAAAAFCSLPVGLMLDRSNLRVALAVGGVLAAISCVLRAAAGDALVLIVAVALFGVAWPLIVGGSAKVIGTYYHGRSRRIAAGVTLAAVNGGFAVIVAVANPVLAAYLAGWRPALLVTAAPAAVATAFWLALPQEFGKEASSSGAPAAVIRDAVDLVRNRAVLIALAPVAAGLIIGHGMSNWLPTLLHSDGLTTNAAGLAAAGFISFGIIGSLAMPIIAAPSARRWFVAGVLLVEAIALPCLHSQSGLVVAIALVAAGVGVGSIPPLMILTLFDTRGAGERAGAVTGLYYSVAGGAGLIGPVIIGSLDGLTGGFTAGLVTLAVVALAGAAMALRLHRPEPVARLELEPVIEPIA